MEIAGHKKIFGPPGVAPRGPGANSGPKRLPLSYIGMASMIAATDTE
jgi:hypothetical protein